MAYPDSPEFIDFVDERTEPAEIEEEQHSITPGSYTYSLNEVPDAEYSISCTGEVHGSYTVSFTNTAPGSGCVYVNPLNGNALHCASDASDNLTWSYWGRGTANNKHMLEQYRDPIEHVHKVARQFWVSATSPQSQAVTIAKGNAEIAGKLVEYNGGTQDFSSATFDNPGYTKAIRITVDSSGQVTYSEGDEASSRALCSDPPAVPASKSIAIVFLRDGADISGDDIVNTLIEVPYHSGDPGSGGSGDAAKYQYEAGVVSGDAVCISSPSTVSKADADDDSLVPAIGFVEAILDDTYCTVRSSGMLDFSNKTTSYSELTYGQQVYLSTAAGRLTQTRNKTPDEWDQSLGIALSSSKVQISIGTATKNTAGPTPGPGPGPEPGPGPGTGNYKHEAGVAEAEFVYLKSDAETVDEAKADSASTMPAIGIVDEVIDATWCVVKNNYQWKTADHGGAAPGGLTPGVAGDVFNISATTEGEAVISAGFIDPEHWVQQCCKQIDDAGTIFLICCSSAYKPEPPDPGDGYDYDCASDVGTGMSVYLDSSSVARKTDISDDSKVNAKGIVKAVNATNNRCTIVCPPNIYQPDTNYVAGEYFLASTAGTWGLRTDPWKPGDWKVRIGFGRGETVGGLQVDIKNYGKLGDPTEPITDGDGDGNVEPVVPDWVFGYFAFDGAGEPINDKWTEQTSAGGCDYSSYNTVNKMLGVLVSHWWDGQSAWTCKVLMLGAYGSGYDSGATYFAGADGGIMAGKSFGHFAKLAGRGRPDGKIDVMGGAAWPFEFVNGDVGDPVPLYPYTAIMNPAPLPQPFEKVRDNDGSTLPIVADYTSEEYIVEVPTVIASVDFFAKSTGVGAGAYLECDLLDVSNPLAPVSLLTTKAHLTAQGDGTRGDTLPSSPNSASHQRAVLDQTKFPLAVGKTIVRTHTRQGVYSTAPYGIGTIINKYGVKE
ncbi:MAG TPA: hypothetical protein VM163_10185 [bacterium]|nr:hypothetical protein [bacterium]